MDPGECPNNVCQPLGYVDASGAWVIEPAFQEAYAFGDDGRARVYDGSYRYIDRTGAPASPRFTVIGDYGPEGLAYIHLDDGTRGPMQVKKGDRVLFTSYAPETIEIDDEEFLLMSESDILAVIE